MLRFLYYLSLNMLSLLFLSCVRRESVFPERSLIYVSIPPQKYFVEKICSDRFRVKTLIPGSASAHSYEPRPSQMADIANARLYFSIGVEMEKVWLQRIRKINPRLAVVAMDSGIVKLRSPGTAADGKDSGGKSIGSVESDNIDRHHGSVDPHIWLSPSRVKLMARRVAEALAAFDTANCGTYLERLAMFEAEIDSLKRTISQRLDSCDANRSFLVFHPAWGYFAEEFSLVQLAVEVEGKEPGIREIENLAGVLRERGIKVMLVQPQFSRKMAENISRNTDIGIAVADPLAENWYENLLQIAGVLCGK